MRGYFNEETMEEELKKIKKKYRNVIKIQQELLSYDYTKIVGLKVGISKSCINWYKKNGEKIGMPYKELNTIFSNPIGKINNVKYDGNTFTFTVVFGTMVLRMGIEDLRF